MSWAQEMRLRSRVLVSPRLMKVKSARPARLPPGNRTTPASSRSSATGMSIRARRMRVLRSRQRDGRAGGAGGGGGGGAAGGRGGLARGGVRVGGGLGAVAVVGFARGRRGLGLASGAAAGSFAGAGRA